MACIFIFCFLALVLIAVGIPGIGQFCEFESPRECILFYVVNLVQFLVFLFYSK